MKKRLTQEEQHNKMMDDILENFNFMKCKMVMSFLGWTWGFPPGRTPEVDEMKKTAKYLMEGAIKGCLETRNCRPEETYISATGGFKAEAIKNKYNHLEFLKLEFVLTEWDSDGDVHDDSSKEVYK
jgi:hypothetical protein